MLAYLPDSIEIADEVLSAVSGVPTARGYAPPPVAATFGASALAAASTGQDIVMDATGASRILAATSSKIYEFGSAAWTDRGSWAGNKTFFLAFGSDTFAIGTAQKPTKVAGSLTAVTAPKAAAGDVAGYFMMLGNTDDGSTGLSTAFGAQPNRWWCSRYADASSAWEPDPTTQCRSALLADSAGGITAIRARGNQFVVYKAGSLYLASYSGPPDVFAFERISDRVGTPCQRAVVKVGAVQYFIGAETIWRFDGNGLADIGDGVREWFFASLDRANNMLIQGRHDPYTQRIYWHYPAVGSSGAITKVLVHHIPSGRWGAFDFTVSGVFPTEGGTLFATTSDGTARVLSMSYLDGSNVIKSLSGAGTALSLTTTWAGDEEQVTLCDGWKPRFGAVAPSAGTIDHDTCMYIGGSITDVAQSAMSGGRFYVLASARYHRAAFGFSGSGFELQALNPNRIAEGLE